MLEFCKDNPERPVDWRWQRAKQLVELNLRIDRYVDDDAVYQARAFCALVSNQPTESRLIKLADNYPDMFYAWQFSQQGDDELLHFEIEARILANESSENIARKCAATPGMINWYEAWFFNVRDRLDSPGYIMNHVIGESVQHGLSERDFATLWKLYGYGGNAEVLDSLIYRSSNTMRPEKPEEVAAFLADDIKQQLRLKAAITARTMPSAFNQQTILETYLRCLELEKAAGGGGTSEGILNNINAFMSNLPWSAGEEHKLVSAEIKKYDDMGISLRSSELLLLGTGQKIPGLEEMAETLKFPESGSDSEPDSSP